MPETHYAKGPDAHLAYQVVGDGPIDLVFIGEWFCHLEMQWEDPTVSRLLGRLASFSRLILFDPRGTGLSDPVGLGALPTVEEWTDDVRIVMDAVASERAALVGAGGGANMAMLFTATHPTRVSALAVINAYARVAQAPDFPHGASVDVFETFLQWVEPRWGTGAVLEAVGRSRADDEPFRQWHGRLERQSVPPGAYDAIMRALYELDLRPALSAISVPTLVVHRSAN